MRELLERLGGPPGAGLASKVRGERSIEDLRGALVLARSAVRDVRGELQSMENMFTDSLDAIRTHRAGSSGGVPVMIKEMKGHKYGVPSMANLKRGLAELKTQLKAA